jgi:DNA-binding transcriptional LysR family regulator
MDLRHLETFLAIVKTGSFVRAAEKLGYSQSTVTMQMQALERELGLSLMVRGERRLTLSEGGRLFREHAERVLADMSSMRLAMSDLAVGDAGTVRIAALDTAASRMAATLARFWQRRPKARVVLECSSSSNVSARVAHGDVDVGFCAPPCAKLGLEFEPLYIEEQLVLLPADHELARRTRISGKDVIQHRVLLTEQGCYYRETTENGFMKSGFLLTPSLEIGSFDALIRAVQNGIGIAILPAFSATPPPEGTVLRPLEGVKVGLSVGIARRADAGPPSVVLKALLDEVRLDLAS